MTPNEIRAACAGSEYITLHLPPPNSQGYTRRLFDSYGPRGEVLCGTPERGQTVRFQSAAMLRCLDRYFPEEEPNAD